MWSLCSNQTMVIKDNCGKSRLYVLIEIGSTHNFINEETERKLNCPMQEAAGI